MKGVEPLTFSLPRKRSTPELHRPLCLYIQKERETGLEPATFSLEG